MTLALTALFDCSKSPEAATALSPSATGSPLLDASAQTATSTESTLQAKPSATEAPPADSSGSAAPSAPRASATPARSLAAKPPAPATASSTGSRPALRASSGSGSGSKTGESGVAKTFECGDKTQPPCPLQNFMKSQVAAAAASGDGAQLAKALDRVAAQSPPNLFLWTSFARDGASKARAGDLGGAKASCKTCHDQYRTRYKAEMRDRKL